MFQLFGILLISSLIAVSTFSTSFALAQPVIQETDVNFNRDTNSSVAFDSASTLSLPLAIQTALANNHDIKRAVLSVKTAKSEVLNAWAEVMPDVNTNVGYTRNLEIPVNFLPAIIFDPNASPDQLIPVAFGTDNNWQGGFTVSQNIFKGEALIGISSAELFLSANQEAQRGIAQQIVTQTRAAYYQVLFAEQQYKLEQNVVTRLEENVRQNKARVEAGLLDSYEILRLEVTLANQKPLVTEAKYAVNQAYRNLSLIMGVPAEFKLNVKGNLASYNLMSSQQDDIANIESGIVNETIEIEPNFPDQAFLIRSDLKSLDIQRSLKIKETQAYKSRYLPTITAEYAWQYTAAQPGSPNFFGNSDQRARFQTLGLNVSLPIFNGLSRSNTIQKAIIQRKDIEVQQDQAKQMASAEIAQLREAFDKIKETASARQKALEQAKRGYKIARSRFEQGFGTQLDVDMAEEQMQIAETNYSAMTLEYLTTKAQYDLAVGKVPFVDIQPQAIKN
jgi:outer membrane protein TolC